MTNFRCNCPITSGIDVLGDKWTLVLIKQMLIENFKTFKEFTESNESISTNILSQRLKHMQELGLIFRTNQPNNKKSNLYLLTEKGLKLIPLIMELTIWSSDNLREEHPTMDYDENLEFVKNNKEEAYILIAEKYKEKTGYNNVQNDNTP
jgi:DNA-binding HxlR family transcriptional regulator